MGLSFRICRFLNNSVKQLPSHDQLHYQKQKLLSVKHFNQLDDIGVVHVAQNGRLNLQILLVLLAHIFLLDDLDCKLLASATFQSQLHDAKTREKNVKISTAVQKPPTGFQKKETNKQKKEQKKICFYLNA